MDLMLLLVWGPWVQTGESWALVRHAVDSLPHFGHGPVQLHPVISQGPWELVRALCGLWSWTLYKAGVEWLNFHLSAVQNLYTNFSPNADSYLPIPLPTMALCTSLMNRQPCSFLFVNSKRDVDFHCSGSTGRSVHEVLMLFLAAGETNHSLSQLMSLFVANDHLQNLYGMRPRTEDQPLTIEAPRLLCQHTLSNSVQCDTRW